MTSAPDPLPKAVAEEGTWQRLHPLTPLVRGWKVLAAVVVLLGQQQGPELFRHGLPSRDEALIGLGVLGVAVLVGGVYVWLAWQRAEYRVDGEALQMRTGVLFRSERQARLDRLQAVDLVRPILARIFGLAELKLEVTGGGDSAVRLSLLPEDEAHAADDLDDLPWVLPETPKYNVVRIEPAVVSGRHFRRRSPA